MSLEEQMDGLRAYYDRCAPEYEKIFYRPNPGRRHELAVMTKRIETLFRGRSVLEVACGTGYFTQIASRVAHRVTATDVSENMLAQAREKVVPDGRVEFCLADAHDLSSLDGRFDAGLAAFWLSHVPVAMIGEFLDRFHEKLGSGAVVFMTDNVYIPGAGGELVRVAGEENTFKRRTLSDGTVHEVLKNYYDIDGLAAMFDPRVADFRVDAGTYYWWLSYRVP